MLTKYLFQRGLNINNIINTLKILKPKLKFIKSANMKSLTFIRSILGFSPVIPFIQPTIVNAKSVENSKFYENISNVSPAILLINGDIQCTGLVINQDGLVLTSSLAVNNTSSIEVIVTNSNKSYSANVLSVDNAKCLALIKVDLPPDSKLPQNLPFGDDGNLSHGQMVFSVGSPYNLTNSVNVGCITSIIKSDTVMEKNDIIYLISDIQSSSSSLGSPLCTYSGEVVGIITRQDSGHTLCMPIRHVVDFINQYFYVIHKEHLHNAETKPTSVKSTSDEQLNWFDKMKTRFFDSKSKSNVLCSAILIEVNDDIKKDFCISNSAYRKLKHGVVVLDLDPNSPLYRDGLRKGDVILEVNNRLVFSPNDIHKELHKNNILLKIVRNNKYHTLKADYINLKN